MSRSKVVDRGNDRVWCGVGVYQPKKRPCLYIQTGPFDYFLLLMCYHKVCILSIKLVFHYHVVCTICSAAHIDRFLG